MMQSAEARLDHFRTFGLKTVATLPSYPARFGFATR